MASTPLSDSNHFNVPQSSVFLIVAILLATGIIVNIGSVAVAQREAAGIRPHGDSRLSTLVAVEQPTLRLRHGFEAHLHDLARGGTIAVPDGNAVNRLMVENFSLVTVRTGGYEPTVTLDQIEALDPGVVIVGSGWTSTHSGEVTYRFLMRDTSLAPSVTFYRVGSDVYIVDDRLGTP